ncbi:glycosyltransferase family protein [Agrobacterium rosae]|uniref:Undecaprenyldiphospho-muramoylpentapeptide beta-N-acetylglucosaminyltransferase n=1 Tax=Agrobacterium rosae TaxID=1972867 RepID=A0A1R3TWY8_9HYPH|nr:undecaprenyldiphospho-muramoylpentapeptide beta-N-acetylglucosaminyltransferase [Agrobacterium rosae]
MGEAPVTATKSAPRVFFYVQHLLGIGHIARASRVARALVEDGFDVTLVTGGTPVPGFPGEGIRHIELPPIAVSDGSFSGLVDATGQPVDDAFKDNRTSMLLGAYRGARPDIVIIEAFPFGRRQVRFELMPLLSAIEHSLERPLVMTSLRDILQERAKPGRDEETIALVKKHFDAVLVHGDPNFVRLEDTFPLADQISQRIVYTGLVAPSKPQPPQERFDVVVSAGGGAVGAALIRAALEAAPLIKGIKNLCFITGPNMPQADFDAISAQAGGDISVFRFRKDFASLLSGARLSISQAGYNTVCDILQAKCRSLLIPFAAGGETEQGARASRLAKLGLAHVLEESAISSQSMANAIEQALDLPEPDSVNLDLDGAAGTAKILRRFYDER